MVNSVDITARRKANALRPDARLSVQAVGSISRRLTRSGFLVGCFFPAIIRFVTERMRASQGGLWVGGDALLTSTAVTFTPNRLNVGLHADLGTLSIALSLDRLSGVRLRRGFMTNIIDIESADGGLCLRCFGAKQFAADIETASSRVNKDGTPSSHGEP